VTGGRLGLGFGFDSGLVGGFLLVPLEVACFGGVSVIARLLLLLEFLEVDAGVDVRAGSF